MMGKTNCSFRWSASSLALVLAFICAGCEGGPEPLTAEVPLQLEELIDAPFGEYQVIALRNASDVATTADPGAGAEWLEQRASFAEGQLTWLGGQTCELWSVREAEIPVTTLEDPNLSDVIARATANPARLLGMADRIGTLQKGAVADIAVFALETGDFEFEDTEGNTLQGTTRLVPQYTVRQGQCVWQT